MGYKKQTCEICNGTGINEWLEYGEKISIKCSRCRGTLISYGSCSSCGFYLNEDGICQSGKCGKRDPNAPSSSGGTAQAKPAAPSSPAQSKQTVPIASSYTPPVITSPEIKFNGVYSSHNFEGLAVSAYIRFYEDKTVIITYSKKTAAQIKKEFDKKKKYIAIGTNYTIKGNEIRYQAKYDDGVSDYIGTITGDQILFNVTGCRIRKSEIYVFTAW